VSKPDAKTIDEEGREVLDPKKALTEQTLAVDLARAEIDMAIATAHKYPRSIDVVLKKITTMACYNEEAAANCVYSLPRAGKPIIGPSIGFANILATAWGNCRDGARLVYVDRRDKVVIAEGAFIDLETNRQTTLPAQRRIVDKHGRLYSDDMIVVTGMAAAAVARRNAILNAVPRALWHPVWEEALKIVRGTAETFAERRDRALKAFAQFGVKPEQVLMVLGLKGEPDLTLEHIPVMRGMYQQLRDGVMTVEEMFDPRRMTGQAFEAVENPLGEEEPSAAGQPQAAQPEADPTAGMGEAPDQGQSAAPAPQAAKPEAGKGATAPAAAAPVAQTQPAAAQPAPAPKNEPAASAAPQAGAAASPVSPQATAALANEEEYLAYWEGFCSSCNSVTALKNQWSADRGLRTRCRVVGAHFDAAKSMLEAAEASLRARG
jgi:hypothetical protein